VNATLQEKVSSGVLTAESVRIISVLLGEFSSQTATGVFQPLPAPANDAEDAAIAADVVRIGARLDALKEVKDGWLDGACAPRPVALEAASTVLESIARSHRRVPRPQIYPTPEGLIQAEWMVGAWAAEATFGVDQVNLEATHADTLEDRTRRIRIDAQCAGIIARWLSELQRSDECV
jgi:hypothetical protein